MKAVLAFALFVTLVAVVCSEACNSTSDCLSHHTTHCSQHTQMHCHDYQCECLIVQGTPCDTDADCDNVCTGHHVHAHCVKKECHCSGH